MDKLERFAYWKTVAADALRAADPGGAARLEASLWTDEDHLFGFFDFFRPDGRGLERVFAGVVGGDEITQRLLEVYRATKESFQRKLYFIVCRPVPAAPEKLADLAAQHLDKVKRIAHQFGDAELAGLLEQPRRIDIVRERPPDRKLPDYESPETIIYDVVGDWFGGRVPIESDALWLREALYSMACDYNIARYVLWPLYRQSTDIQEPFTPYFALWTHGAQAVFERPGRVTVYVAGDS